MRSWLLDLGYVALWWFLVIENYHRGDFMKWIALALFVATILFIIYSVCKGLLWLLRTLIIADLNEKLRKETQP